MGVMMRRVLFFFFFLLFHFSFYDLDGHPTTIDKSGFLSYSSVGSIMGPAEVSVVS